MGEVEEREREVGRGEGEWEAISKLIILFYFIFVKGKDFLIICGPNCPYTTNENLKEIEDSPWIASN